VSTPEKTGVLFNRLMKYENKKILVSEQEIWLGLGASLLLARMVGICRVDCLALLGRIFPGTT
jgi:hypothetical protein